MSDPVRVILILCVVAAVGVSAGCGDDASESSLTATATTEETEGSDVMVLRSAGPPPPELEPGRYRTGEGFVPPVTFTLPAGWFGNQDSAGFALGKGIDEAAEEFADVGIFVSRVDLPLARATAGFEKIETLRVTSAKRVELGGSTGRTYEVSVPGDHAVLEPIGLFADIPHGDARVTFLDIRGGTLMISLDGWSTAADRAEAERVLESFRFPR